MKVLAIAAAAALALCLGACNTLSDVTKNPNCVTRVSIKGSYGSVTPTGTYSASAVCGGSKAPTKAADVAPPPAEDKTPDPPA
jgi:hypothetical protein